MFKFFKVMRAAFIVVIVLTLTGCTKDYTVTFVDSNGVEIHQSIIEEGEDAIPPKAPNIEGYTFSGWSISFENIESDLVIEPQYEIMVYTISFYNYDDELLGEFEVEHGGTVEAPEQPTRIGHEFFGWSQNLENIKSDLVIKAQYEINTYVVSFYDYKDMLLEEFEVEHGGTVEAPEQPARLGYEFVGWSQDFENIGSDLNIYTLYEILYFDITYQDADGEVILVESLPYGSMPDYNLPDDTSAWDYLEWSPSVASVTEDTIYTATRDLKDSFFYGNVFQIIVYDLGEIPISLGTGFVLNEEGWFITNAHVMKDGYYADAMFEIPNASEGSRYFNLEIDSVLYFDLEKDIFIGKIADYQKNLGSHYQPISFTDTYEIGDTTFSVGYPYSVTELEINEGNIIQDISSLYDKIYTGVRYIGSTSFIAPGSSGGVLINNNLEVLGITSIGLYDDDGNFELGGSVESFNFMYLLNNLDSSELTDYAITMHPNEENFITFFRGVKENENAEVEYYSNYTRYAFVWDTEGETDDGYFYLRTETLYIDSDGWIEFNDEIYWDDGDNRSLKFYGFYSSQNKLSDFYFVMEYEYSSGNYFIVESNNINYSQNINLTLINHTVTSSSYYDVSQSEVDYAKESFNRVYEWIYGFIYPE